MSVISFTLRPGPVLKEDTPLSQALINGTISEPFSASTVEPELEVTLSSLLIKNIAEQLVTNFKISTNATTDSLETISLQMASNISSSLRDMWDLTLKTKNSTDSLNHTDYDDVINGTFNSSNDNNDGIDNNSPLHLNLTNILILKKQKADTNDWYSSLFLFFSIIYPLIVIN